MGGCLSQEEHRLQSRPAEAAGADGLRKSKSDSKAVASVLAPPKDVVDLQVEGYGNVNIFTYDELSAATKKLPTRSNSWRGWVWSCLQRCN